MSVERKIIFIVLNIALLVLGVGFVGASDVSYTTINHQTAMEEINDMIQSFGKGNITLGYTDGYINVNMDALELVFGDIVTNDRTVVFNFGVDTDTFDKLKKSYDFYLVVVPKFEFVGYWKEHEYIEVSSVVKLDDLSRVYAEPKIVKMNSNTLSLNLTEVQGVYYIKVDGGSSTFDKISNKVKNLVGIDTTEHFAAFWISYLFYVVVVPKNNNLYNHILVVEDLNYGIFDAILPSNIYYSAKDIYYIHFDDFAPVVGATDWSDLLNETTMQNFYKVLNHEDYRKYILTDNDDILNTVSASNFIERGALPTEYSLNDLYILSSVSEQRKTLGLLNNIYNNNYHNIIPTSSTGVKVILDKYTVYARDNYYVKINDVTTPNTKHSFVILASDGRIYSYDTAGSGVVYEFIESNSQFVATSNLDSIESILKNGYGLEDSPASYFVLTIAYYDTENGIIIVPKLGSTTFKIYVNDIELSFASGITDRIRYATDRIVKLSEDRYRVYVFNTRYASSWDTYESTIDITINMNYIKLINYFRRAEILRNFDTTLHTVTLHIEDEHGNPVKATVRAYFVDQAFEELFGDTITSVAVTDAEGNVVLQLMKADIKIDIIPTDGDIYQQTSISNPLLLNKFEWWVTVPTKQLDVNTLEWYNLTVKVVDTKNEPVNASIHIEQIDPVNNTALVLLTVNGSEYTFKVKETIPVKLTVTAENYMNYTEEFKIKQDTTKKVVLLKLPDTIVHFNLIANISGSLVNVVSKNPSIIQIFISDGSSWRDITDSLYLNQKAGTVDLYLSSDDYPLVSGNYYRIKMVFERDYTAVKEFEKGREYTIKYYLKKDYSSYFSSDDGTIVLGNEENTGGSSLSEAVDDSVKDTSKRLADMSAQTRYFIYAIVMLIVTAGLYLATYSTTISLLAAFMVTLLFSYWGIITKDIFFSVVVVSILLLVQRAIGGGLGGGGGAEVVVVESDSGDEGGGDE